MVDYLVSSTNQAIADFQGSKPQELDALISERRRLEPELYNNRTWGSGSSALRVG